MRINNKTCKTCTKYSQDKKECMVLTETRYNCFAWSDDPDWFAKVDRAVEKYKLNKKRRGLDG